MALTCGQTGIYSVAFALKGISSIVASDLQVAEANKEIEIKSSHNFECPATQIDQTIIVYLLDNRGEPLTGGVIPLFDEFASLEPTTDSESDAFESQKLK